jgi:hypothetical protein
LTPLLFSNADMHSHCGPFFGAIRGSEEPPAPSISTALANNDGGTVSNIVSSLLRSTEGHPSIGYQYKVFLILCVLCRAARYRGEEGRARLFSSSG